MRTKKVRQSKQFYKERNKSITRVPPPSTGSVSKPGSAPKRSLFSTLAETMGQGAAFGMGSSIGHSLINSAGSLLTSQPNIDNSNNQNKTINGCNHLKIQFEDCLDDSQYCDTIRDSYLDCVDRMKKFATIPTKINN